MKIGKFFEYKENIYSSEKCFELMELDYSALIEHEVFDNMIELLKEYCEYISYESDKDITIDYFLNTVGKEQYFEKIQND